MPSSNSPERQHLEWNIETDSDDQDVTIVRLCGSAGVGSEAEFASCIRAIERLQSSTVVLELSQLTFISSVAMGGLIVLKKSIEDRHGSLQLAHVPPSILKSLQATRLDTIFDISGQQQ